MTCRGPTAGLTKDRKVDGDCDAVYISQLLVRAEMEAPMGDMEELDSKKTNQQNPQGSSITVTSGKRSVIFTFVTVRQFGGKL